MSEIRIHPLQRARKRLGIRQKVLADLTGLSEPTIKRAEHGEALSDYSIAQICQYFSQRYRREVGREELGLHARWEDESKKETQKELKVLQLVHSQKHFLPPLSDEDKASSQSLLSCVMIMMNHCQFQAVSYSSFQQAIDQEIGRFDHMKHQHLGDDSTLSRRDALVLIAGFPLSLLLKMPQSTLITSAIAEDFLMQCTASITVCWHLMRGNQLSVVEEALPAYLPILTALAQQPSQFQKAAASLTIQGYLIRGILAFHQLQLPTRIRYCQEAKRYTELATDSNLEVGILLHLADTFYHLNAPLQALETYQEALLHKEDVSPLLKSHIYSGLARSSAQCKQEQDALTYTIKAHEVFSQYPEDDPAFLYADHTLAALSMREGVSYLDLGQYYPEKNYYQQAQDVFAQVIKLHPATMIPERIRIKIINYQAQVTLGLGDLEGFSTYLEQGVNGAKMLGSQKRRQEAIDIYKQARVIWPNESQVKELADLFI